MARFSQQFLAQTASPTFGRGLFDLAQNIGGLGAMRAQNEAAQQRADEKNAAMRLVNEALASNDPEQLLAAAQSIQTIDPAVAVKLSQAAGLANKAKKAAQIKGLEETAADATVKAQKARAIQMARQAGDTVGLAQVRSGALSPADYINEQADRQRQTQQGMSSSDRFKTVGNRIFDVVEQKYIEPSESEDPKISFQTRDNGDLQVFSGTELVQTYPASQKQDEGSKESAMNVITKSVFLEGQVDKLMGDVPATGSGFLGQTVGKIGGTAGYDRDRDIINLKANLGFEQINEMKRQAALSGASGTGLGQISNIEFMSLQSTVDALDVGMSAEAQREALANIKRHLETIRNLASGVAKKDAIAWERSDYKAAGYHKDPKTGKVFYAPDGRNGKVYELIDGEFKPMRSF